MSGIEHELRGLGSDLWYPTTPELAPAVMSRLAISDTRERRRAGRSLAIAAATLLLAGGSAVAAVPALRHTVLGWLGLRSVRIQRVPSISRLPIGPAGRNLGLGRRTTLAAARSRVAFRVLVPARAAPEVYLSNSPPGGQVAFVYPPGPGLPRAPGTDTGLLITEFLGQQPRAYIQKSLAPGTSATFLTVGGSPGVWISGRPHEFAYLDSQEKARAETLRLAGNTLLWRHGAVLISLEARISRQAALRIALSLR